MVAALQAARRPRLEATRRDLDRSPYSPEDLAGFDAVLLDPPRAGAPAQAAALAAAAVPLVVYASCGPASFARDARILVDGGYELAEVRPVDQFLYSAEVELIARFTRRGKP
jgi:23S rRNA (uracil1939-C5)-methyltransferase